jgi:hypothetical protein
MTNDETRMTSRNWGRILVTRTESESFGVVIRVLAGLGAGWRGWAGLGDLRRGVPGNGDGWVARYVKWVEACRCTSLDYNICVFFNAISALFCHAKSFARRPGTKVCSEWREVNEDLRSFAPLELGIIWDVNPGRRSFLALPWAISFAGRWPSPGDASQSPAVPNAACLRAMRICS